MAPSISGRSALPKMPPRSRRGCAPNATLTPISRHRWATMNVMSMYHAGHREKDHNHHHRAEHEAKVWSETAAASTCPRAIALSDPQLGSSRPATARRRSAGRPTPDAVRMVTFTACIEVVMGWNIFGPSWSPGKSSTTPTISWEPGGGATSRVFALPREPMRRPPIAADCERAAENFCDERSVEDPRFRPGSNRRLETAAGQKARAEDREEPIVHGVESRLVTHAPSRPSISISAKGSSMGTAAETVTPAIPASARSCLTASTLRLSNRDVSPSMTSELVRNSWTGNPWPRSSAVYPRPSQWPMAQSPPSTRPASPGVRSTSLPSARAGALASQPGEPRSTPSSGRMKRGYPAGDRGSHDAEAGHAKDGRKRRREVHPERKDSSSAMTILDNRSLNCPASRKPTIPAPVAETSTSRNSCVAMRRRLAPSAMRTANSSRLVTVRAYANGDVGHGGIRRSTRAGGSGRAPTSPRQHRERIRRRRGRRAVRVVPAARRRLAP